MSPRRGRIGSQRIVHPLADFMRPYRGVGGVVEEPGGVEIGGRIGLGRNSKRAVVAEDATVEQIGRVIAAYDHVVHQENRKGGRTNALSGERRDESGLEI